MRGNLSTGRTLRAAGVALACSWICVLVLVQWILLMGHAALQVETVTGIRLTDFGHWVRGQLSKPLSPPKQ
jgi:hypothetical protein